MPALILLVMNYYVGHATTIATSALSLADALVVVVVRFGVFGDDIPRVKQAGDVAQDTEKNVDHGVGGTDAALDPDC